MPENIIRKRARFFLAVEGESEQSFVKWLQELTDNEKLYVHLHYDVLSGGGYKTMIDRAVTYRKRGLSRGSYKQSFLLVDGDRTFSGRDWSMEQLIQEANAKGFTLCCQMPNLEALLLRMLPGKENVVVPNATSAISQLTALWPDYQKPADARTLGRKYSLEDLKRAAARETSLQLLLRQIGLL